MGNMRLHPVIIQADGTGVAGSDAGQSTSEWESDMSERVWWSEGVLSSHGLRDRFQKWSDDPEQKRWTGNFFDYSWEGRIAPSPPTQIHYARPLYGDGETPDQLDDGSGRKLDLVFGWESKYFFSHEALAFMKALDLPNARF